MGRGGGGEGGRERGREGGREGEGEWWREGERDSKREKLVHVLHCVLNRSGPATKTHPESKCPELLANYCDMLLRKTPLSKKLTSEETEGKLRDVVRTTLLQAGHYPVKLMIELLKGSETRAV